MRARIITSVEELESLSPAWDDLWQRSELTLPTAQAGLLAQWLRHFEPSTRFRAVLVEEGDRLLAALPLVEHRFARCVNIGRLTHNDWTTGGDLMIAQDVDLIEVAQILRQCMLELPWPMIWMGGCRRDLPSWVALRDVFEREAAGCTVAGHERFRIGQVRIPDSFEEYEKSWSGNHRRHMRKAARRIEQDGGCELEVLDRLRPDDVEASLQKGFEIELRSWKGVAGTSVLAFPRMFAYYVEQARRLAEAEQLQIVFLHHRGQPIAFEYGWRSKGSYFTPKVAYDERFSKYTPGQLLRYHYLRRITEQRPGELINFLGPLSDATAKWTTSEYAIDSVFVSLSPISGRTLLASYRAMRHVRGLTPALPIDDVPGVLAESGESVLS